MASEGFKKRVVEERGLVGRALSPFLGRAGRARADDTEGPRRVVVIVAPNGPIHFSGPASGAERDFTLDAPWAPLERHKDIGVFFRGMAQAGTYFGENNQLGHQAGGVGAITCRATEGTDQTTGPSLDAFLGQELERRGIITPRRNALWGLHDNSHSWGPWFDGVASPVAPVSNPFDALADVIPGLGVAGPGVVQHALERRHFVLDRIGAECRTLSSELGSEARQRLEFHCSQLESLEASIGATLGRRQPLECSPPDLSAIVSPESNFRDANIRDETWDAFVDLTALSLTCDVTRVIGLSFGTAAARFAIPDSYGVPSSSVRDSGDSGPQHHAWTHHHPASDEAIGALTTFYEWYSERVARVLDKLRSTFDADGRPLMDSTLVLYTSEMGAFSGAHPLRNVPVMLFGNSCGAFETNRFYDGTEQDPEVSARVLHQLMLSVVHHVIPDVPQFGNLDCGPLDWLRV